MTSVTELCNSGIGVGNLDLIFSVKNLVNVQALLHAVLHLGDFLNFAVHLTQVLPNVGHTRVDIANTHFENSKRSIHILECLFGQSTGVVVDG